MRSLSLWVMGAVIAAGAPAAVIRVPEDSPTIQAGIDAAVNGDTVRVSPGTYYERLVITKTITLESARGPGRTTIVGVGHLTAQRTIQISAANTTVRGFTLTNAADTPQGIFIVGTGHHIEGNVFDGTDQAASTAGTAVWVFSGAATISRNVFLNHRCDQQALSGVVTITNSSPVELVNNLFVNNDCQAVLDAGQALYAVNNTFVGNRVGIVVQAFGTLVNNILVGGGEGIVVRSGFAPQVANNLLHRNGTDYVGMADATGTAGNLHAPPGFVAPEQGDFRLLAKSPAVDAGRDAGAPTIDFDGVPRPLDGNGDDVAVTDIGAFERH